MLTILAPAKLNLTLEVLAERPDGFHEIRSVIQTISLCDSLRFRSGQKIEFSSDMPEWIPEKSLVSGAASLLRETAGSTEGAAIEISKRIPLVSGLGGDSSDAAATLCGLNRLWGLGLTREELLELAVQLGSDVAFFLYGGTALIEGRGEVVTPLPPLPCMWVVVVVPPVPRLVGKTGQLYAGLDASHYTDGQITKRLTDELKAGSEPDPSLLFNAFEDVTFDGFTGLKEYWQRFLEAGAQGVHLAGSGPALFTLVKDKARAEGLCLRLQEQGLECYLAETSFTERGD